MIYPALATLQPGGLLPYEEMGRLLNLDVRDVGDKQKILGAARRAADVLLARESRVCKIVHGRGYQRTNQVLAQAGDYQARAVAEVKAGHDGFAGALGSPATPPEAHRLPRPRRSVARWEVIYQALAKLQPGDLLSYQDMADLLGLDVRDLGEKQALLGAARKAADELRARERKVCTIVYGRGYQHARADQILALAHGHQARAVAEVEVAHSKIETIDLSQVEPTLARLIQATAAGFTRQATMMRQLDVRQARLETVMAAVQGTAQAAITQAQQTSTRVDATQTQLHALEQRIADLETQRGHPPPHPVFLHPVGV
ncbi:hypothetical protein AB0I61_32970 [Polymorphospora rubra]|uniref:hypothetical protein n=1 Tax=Polymorphospora rubra TaxID=338584 RepID=UPI0033CC44D1